MHDSQQPGPPLDGPPPPPRHHQQAPTQRGIEIRLPRPVAIGLLALFLIAILSMDWWLDPLAADVSVNHLFATLFFCCAVLSAFFFVILLRKKRALSQWIPTSATVVESQVVTSSINRYRQFLYEYAVGGQVYRCGRLAFYRYSRTSGLEYVARYPVGSQLQVYYDPAQPAEAVVERDFRALWVVPLAAIAWGALAVYFFTLAPSLAS